MEPQFIHRRAKLWVPCFPETSWILLILQSYSDTTLPLILLQLISFVFLSFLVIIIAKEDRVHWLIYKCKLDFQNCSWTHFLRLVWSWTRSISRSICTSWRTQRVYATCPRRKGRLDGDSWSKKNYRPPRQPSKKSTRSAIWHEDPRNWLLNWELYISVLSEWITFSIIRLSNWGIAPMTDTWPKLQKRNEIFSPWLA